MHQWSADCSALTARVQSPNERSDGRDNSADARCPSREPAKTLMQHRSKRTTVRKIQTPVFIYSSTSSHPNDTVDDPVALELTPFPWNLDALQRSPSRLPVLWTVHLLETESLERNADAPGCGAARFVALRSISV
jgi:hypothetical protein